MAIHKEHVVIDVKFVNKKADGPFDLRAQVDASVGKGRYDPVAAQKGVGEGGGDGSQASDKLLDTERPEHLPKRLQTEEEQNRLGKFGKEFDPARNEFWNDVAQNNPSSQVVVDQQAVKDNNDLIGPTSGSPTSFANYPSPVSPNPELTEY